jgi:hypothetical protein
MSVGATTTLHRLEAAAQECQTAFSETCDLLQKVQKAISDLELFEQAMRDPGKVTPAIMAHLLKTYQATEARELPEKIHAAISEMINLLRGKGTANQDIIEKRRALISSILHGEDKNESRSPGTKKIRRKNIAVGKTPGRPPIPKPLSPVEKAAQALSDRIQIMQMNQGNLHQQEELLRRQLEQIKAVLPQPQPVPMEGVTADAMLEQRFRALSGQPPRPEVSARRQIPLPFIFGPDPAVQPLVQEFAQHLNYASRTYLLQHGFGVFGPNVLRNLPPSFIKSLSPEDFEHISWQWLEKQAPEDLRALSARSVQFLKKVFSTLPEGQWKTHFDTHIDQQVTGPGHRMSLSEESMPQFPSIPIAAPSVEVSRRLQADSLAPYLQRALPPSFFTVEIPEQVIASFPEEYLLQLSSTVLESLDPTKWSASRMREQWTPLPAEFANSLSPDVYRACGYDQFATLTPNEMAKLRSLGPDFINTHAVLLQYFSLKRFLSFNLEVLDKLKPDVLAAMEPQVLEGIKPEKWNEFTDEMFDLLNAAFLNKLGKEYIGNLTKAAFEHLFRPSLTRAKKLEILENYHPDSSRSYFPHLHEIIAQRAVEAERGEAEEEAKKQAAYGASIGQQGAGWVQIGAGTLSAAAVCGGLKVSGSFAGEGLTAGGSYVSQGLTYVGLEEAGKAVAKAGAEAGAEVAAAAARPLEALITGASGLAIAANLFSIARQAPTWGPEEWAACVAVSVAAGAGVVVFTPAAAGVLGIGLAASTAGSALTLPAARLGKKLWPYGKRFWHGAKQRATRALKPKRQVPTGGVESQSTKKRKMEEPPSEAPFS